VEAPTSETSLKLLCRTVRYFRVNLGAAGHAVRAHHQEYLPFRDRITYSLCYEDRDARPANRKARVINQLMIDRH
jgi:hypothetical protein